MCLCTKGIALVSHEWAVTTGPDQRINLINLQSNPPTLYASRMSDVADAECLIAFSLSDSKTIEFLVGGDGLELHQLIIPPWDIVVSHDKN